ncbi:MAG: recombination mediator RecR [Ghiorsea sp.]
MHHLSGMPEPLARLVEQLSAFQGVGPKTAMRLALNMLEQSESEVQNLASSLQSLHQEVNFCQRCGGFATASHCNICDNMKRQHQVVCIVEQPVDVLMLERGHFQGSYHVLHGRLSPVDGVGPEKLTFTALDKRIAGGTIQELILATSATVDGEATAHFIARRYAHLDIQVSRIARGVPEGGELEYLDEYTLARALEQRVLWEQERSS